MALPRNRSDKTSTAAAEYARAVWWTLDGLTGEFTREQPLPEHLGLGERTTFDIGVLDADMHPDDVPPVLAQLKCSMKDGSPGAYSVRLRAADGGWLTYQVHYQCEQLDGRWILHGVSQDITQLVAERDGALAAGAEARHIIESAPFATCILDRQLRYISISKAWAEMIDASPEHLFEGASFASSQSAATRRRAVRLLTRVLSGEVVDRVEDRLVTASGKRLIARFHMRP